MGYFLIKLKFSKSFIESHNVFDSNKQHIDLTDQYVRRQTHINWDDEFRISTTSIENAKKFDKESLDEFCNEFAKYETHFVNGLEFDDLAFDIIEKEC